MGCATPQGGTAGNGTKAGSWSLSGLPALPQISVRIPYQKKGHRKSGLSL